MKSDLKRSIPVKLNGQFSGLPSVVPFVAPGCSSQSSLLPLHRPLAKKNTRVPKKEHLYFSLLRSRSSHGHFPAFVVATAYAKPLPSFARHRAVFASAATYFFSGCSFAQPSTSLGTLTLK